MLNGQDIRALLGRRIQFYRKQRQFTQASLAEMADISINFLSKIERGIRYPTPETLSGIANGLEVELSDLFRQDETPADQQIMLDRLETDVIKIVKEVFNAYNVTSSEQRQKNNIFR